LPVIDQDLARRVYAYFIFRLRQPSDAERLTQLTFQRVWEAERMQRDPGPEAELPVFAAARAVIAENPRQRGAVRVSASTSTGMRGGGSSGLSDPMALAIGRLHGRERDALALRFGAELSIGEIAQLLDRTPADVKQRLARGIRSLIGLGLLAKEGGSAAEGTGAGGSQESDSQQQ
jgi:DNA-directed RNA polymerase specialized sigma24 family protein